MFVHSLQLQGFGLSVLLCVFALSTVARVWPFSTVMCFCTLYSCKGLAFQYCYVFLHSLQLQGFGLSVLSKVDPNEDNHVAAGLVNTKTQPVGCLLRLEPNKATNVCVCVCGV